MTKTIKTIKLVPTQGIKTSVSTPPALGVRLETLYLYNAAAINQAIEQINTSEAETLKNATNAEQAAKDAAASAGSSAEHAQGAFIALNTVKEYAATIEKTVETANTYAETAKAADVAAKAAMSEAHAAATAAKESAEKTEQNEGILQGYVDTANEAATTATSNAASAKSSADAAADSMARAAAAQSEAETSKTSAAQSATNAANSAKAAAASESNAQTSMSDAAVYANAAATSASNAAKYAANAQTAATSAQESKNAAQGASESAAQSAQSADSSAQSAQSAANAAAGSESNAAEYAANAQTAATSAQESKESAATSESNAANSATDAQQYAQAAKNAQTATEDAQSKAAASQSAAQAAQSAAKKSEENAQAAQTAAATSESNAANSASAAANSQTAAASSANAAAQSAQSANSSKQSAAEDATAAQSAAQAASASAENAQSQKTAAQVAAQAATASQSAAAECATNAQTAQSAAETAATNAAASATSASNSAAAAAQSAKEAQDAVTAGIRPATSEQLGGVIVGETLKVENGKINLSDSNLSKINDTTRDVENIKQTIPEKASPTNQLATKVDLTDYVKNTDYASASKGGVFKTDANYGTEVDASGSLYGCVETVQSLATRNNHAFISKGTLENIKNDTVKRAVTENDITLTDEEKTAAQDWLGIKQGASLPILMAMWSDHLLNDISWLRADTFSWHSGDVYVAAYNHLAEDIDDATAETETIGNITITYYLAEDGHKICLPDQEANLVSLYESTGVAWYFLLDTASKQFKLPRTKWGFTGLRDEVGKYVAPGLPNITGKFGIFGQWDAMLNQYSGAFTYETLSNKSGSAGSYDNIRVGVFNASRSNSIYGNGATVQPPATQMHLYFYVGNFEQTAIEQTAGLNAEMFNSLNESKIIDYQLPSSGNGHTWYLKFANGLVAQGGRVSINGQISSSNKRITLPVVMANSTYVCMAACNANISSAAYIGWESTTAFSIGITASATNTGTTTWLVIGMAA